MSISQSYFTEIIIVDKSEEVIAIVTDSVSADDSVNRLAYRNKRRAIAAPARNAPVVIAARPISLEPQTVAQYSAESISRSELYANVNAFDIDNMVLGYNDVKRLLLECKTNLIANPTWISDLINYSISLRKDFLNGTTGTYSSPTIPWKSRNGEIKSDVMMRQSNIYPIEMENRPSVGPWVPEGVNSVLLYNKETIIYDIAISAPGDYLFTVNVAWFVKNYNFAENIGLGYQA